VHGVDCSDKGSIPVKIDTMGEIAKLRDMVAVDVEEDCEIYLFSPTEILNSIMQAAFHLQIHKTKFTKPKWYDNQMISEN